MSKSGKRVQALLQAQHDVAEARSHKRLRELHLEALRLNLGVPLQLRESCSTRISWSDKRQRYMESSSIYGAAGMRQTDGLASTLHNAIEGHKRSRSGKPSLSGNRRQRVS